MLLGQATLASAGTQTKTSLHPLYLEWLQGFLRLTHRADGDRFGNCRLAGDVPDLTTAIGEVAAGQPLAVDLAGRGHQLVWSPTFGLVDPGEALIYRDGDTAGLALAVNQGSAAARFGLALGDLVRIETA